VIPPASLIDIVIGASSIVGAAAALLVVGAAVRNWYRRSLGRRWTNYGRLKRLGTGAQLSFFEAVLTEPPAIRRTVEVELREYQERLGRSVERLVKRDFTECFFTDRDYYVQTLSDGDDTVHGFSVTTRRKRFKPHIVFPDLGRRARRRIEREIERRWGPFVEIRLGHTRFDRAVPNRDWKPSLKFALGARTWSYSELYYFGNPGYYQTFVFTASGTAGGFPVGDLAALTEEIGPDYPPGSAESDPADFESPQVQRFRRETAVTTYTVFMTPVLGNHFPVNFGPHEDHVRTLP
jgi:hypothetical protein